MKNKRLPVEVQQAENQEIFPNLLGVDSKQKSRMYKIPCGECNKSSIREKKRKWDIVREYGYSASSGILLSNCVIAVWALQHTRK